MPQLVPVEGLRECGSSETLSLTAAFGKQCRPHSKSCLCVRHARTCGTEGPVPAHFIKSRAGQASSDDVRPCIKSATAFIERLSARAYLPSPLVASVMIRTVWDALIEYALRALRTSLESVYSRFRGRGESQGG